MMKPAPKKTPANICFTDTRPASKETLRFLETATAANPVLDTLRTEGHPILVDDFPYDKKMISSDCLRICDLIKMTCSTLVYLRR